ncbi:MAG TPA: DUF6152 family protein [Gammaproteobacteria bacterium]
MIGRTGVALAACLGAADAWAHHGIANFDMNREVAVEGVITDIAFINPHSWLYFDVRAEDGSIQHWKCELRGGTVLRRSGWSPEMFVIGSTVKVTGAPDRFEPHTCYTGTIVLADGRSMDRYGQLAEAPKPPPVERPLRRPTGEPNLAGDWAPEQRVMTDPRGISGALLPVSVVRGLEPGELPDGVRPFPGARGTPESLAPDAIRAAWTRPSPVTLTEAGRRAIEGFDPSSRDNPRLRCEPTNIIFDWTFEQLVNRITQEPDRIRIQYGAVGIDRTIHLSMSEHPADIEPSVTGHSIGWWEGDVLVVDTVGFAPGILSADARVPHSAELHVVERFTLSEDGRAITREYVAEDPLYFEGQYRGRDTVYVADLPYETPSCDDRSYVTPDDESAPASAEPAASEPAPTPPSKPWWKFWD